MRNSFASFGLTLMLGLTISGAARGADSLPEADADATWAVQSYLQALVLGDVDSLRTWLAEGLVEQRVAMLDNPDYGLLLRDEYAGATFEIVDTRQLNQEQAQVEARIDSATGEALSVRFMLQATDEGYRITSEN